MFLPNLFRVEAYGQSRIPVYLLFSFEINVLEKDGKPHVMPTLTKFAYESFSIQSVSSKDRRYSIIHL